MAILDEESLFSNPLYGSQSSEIDAILSRPNIDSATRKLAQSVKRKERLIEQAGLDAGEAEPRESLFWQALDLLDAPRQGIAGVVDAALRGDIFEPGVGTGFRRGQIENTTASDIFRRHDIIDNPVLRGVTGFAADILTDPLTYLTFGTGTAAKAAGRTLTSTGRELSKQVLEKAVEKTGDILQSSDIVDDVFSGISRYQQAERSFGKATTDSVKAFEADKMAKALEYVKDYVDPAEFLNRDIFEKAKVRVGINLPFLGHFQKAEKAAAKEIVMKDPGPVGQVLRAAGKAFKPGKVSIANIDLSDDLVDSFGKLGAYANDRLMDLGNALDAIPVLGSATKKTASLGKQGVQKANELFRKIFNQKALIGADANRNRLNYIDLAQGARQMARERALKVLPPEEFGRDLQREIYLAIDSQAMGAVRDAAGESKDALDAINKIRRIERVDEGDQLLFRELAQKSGAEEGFRERIDNVLSDPNVNTKVKEGIQRVMYAMDEVALEEAQNGLNYTRLEYYLPHKYLNVDKGKSAIGSSGKHPSFLKERKYNTIAEAFEQSGKVADDNLLDLMRYRFEKSLTLQAQRKYAQRLMIEEGLNPETVSAMYREALLNPKGEAAKVLSRNRIKVSAPDLDQLKDAKAMSERAKIWAKVGLKDQEASRIIGEAAGEWQQKINEELWANGIKPLDNQLAQHALGEIGEEVVIPGSLGKEKMILPKPIADSFKETIAAKDIVKETLGKSPFAKAALKVLDHGTSTFKRWATFPWPAYWGQNLLGDRFLQAMQGVEAIDPGIFARTHSVLSGKSAIKSPSGVVLDKSTLERVMKQSGIKTSLNEYIDAMDTFGDMNVDKHLAHKNTLFTNITKAFKKPNRQAALEQMHSKMQDKFENFFRVSQFIHRFEKGDTVSDALRSASDTYFNYRDLSEVERSLFRRFYMFYGFMSKATKRTLNSLITAPGNITMQLHGVNALAETLSDPNAAPSVDEHDLRMLRSTVAREQLSRVVGKNKKGQPIVGRGFASPLNAIMQQFTLESPRNFSIGELTDTAMDSARRTLQKQFAAANPAINATAQLVSGKNLYFDKPLSSEFLRKFPSLNEAAKRISGLKYNELPVDLDAVTKKFLKAVPDGKGRLIGDPNRMWILSNLVPGLGRFISTAGTLTNTDIDSRTAALRALTNINVDDTDVSRTYLHSRNEQLDKFIEENSVNRRLRNLREDLDNE